MPVSDAKTSLKFQKQYADMIELEAEPNEQLRESFEQYRARLSQGLVPPPSEGDKAGGKIALRSEADRVRLYGLTLLKLEHMANKPKSEGDVVQAVNRMISGPVLDVVRACPALGGMSESLHRVEVHHESTSDKNGSRLDSIFHGTPNTDNPTVQAVRKKAGSGGVLLSELPSLDHGKAYTYIPNDVKTKLTFRTDDILWTLYFGLLVVEFKGPKKLDGLANDLKFLGGEIHLGKANSKDYKGYTKNGDRLKGVQSLILQICRYSRDYGVEFAYVTDFDVHAVFRLPVDAWTEQDTDSSEIKPQVQWLVGGLDMQPRLFMLWALYRGCIVHSVQKQFEKEARRTKDQDLRSRKP